MLKKNCIVWDCDRDPVNSPNVSFFNLPEQSEKFEKWITFSKRDDLLLRAYDGDLNCSSIGKICAMHFTENTLTDNGSALVDNATPSIFSSEFVNFIRTSSCSSILQINESINNTSNNIESIGENNLSTTINQTPLSTLNLPVESVSIVNRNDLNTDTLPNIDSSKDNSDIETESIDHSNIIVTPMQEINQLVKNEPEIMVVDCPSTNEITEKSITTMTDINDIKHINMVNNQESFDNDNINNTEEYPIVFIPLANLNREISISAVSTTSTIPLHPVSHIKREPSPENVSLIESSNKDIKIQMLTTLKTESVQSFPIKPTTELLTTEQIKNESSEYDSDIASDESSNPIVNNRQESNVNLPNNQSSFSSASSVSPTKLSNPKDTLLNKNMNIYEIDLLNSSSDLSNHSTVKNRSKKLKRKLTVTGDESEFSSESNIDDSEHNKLQPNISQSIQLNKIVTKLQSSQQPSLSTNTLNNYEKALLNSSSESSRSAVNGRKRKLKRKLTITENDSEFSSESNTEEHVIEKNSQLKQSEEVINGSNKVLSNSEDDTDENNMSVKESSQQPSLFTNTLNNYEKALLNSSSESSRSAVNGLKQKLKRKLTITENDSEFSSESNTEEHVKEKISQLKQSEEVINGSNKVLSNSEDDTDEHNMSVKEINNNKDDSTDILNAELITENLENNQIENNNDNNPLSSANMMDDIEMDISFTLLPRNNNINNLETQSSNIQLTNDNKVSSDEESDIQSDFEEINKKSVIVPNIQTTRKRYLSSNLGNVTPSSEDDSDNVDNKRNPNDLGKRKILTITGNESEFNVNSSSDESSEAVINNRQPLILQFSKQPTTNSIKSSNRKSSLSSSSSSSDDHSHNSQSIPDDKNNINHMLESNIDKCSDGNESVTHLSHQKLDEHINNNQSIIETPMQIDLGSPKNTKLNERHQKETRNSNKKYFGKKTRGNITRKNRLGNEVVSEYDSDSSLSSLNSNPNSLNKLSNQQEHLISVTRENYINSPDKSVNKNASIDTTEILKNNEMLSNIAEIKEDSSVCEQTSSNSSSSNNTRDISNITNNTYENQDLVNTNCNLDNNISASVSNMDIDNIPIEYIKCNENSFIAEDFVETQMDVSHIKLNETLEELQGEPLENLQDAHNEIMNGEDIIPFSQSNNLYLSQKNEQLNQQKIQSEVLPSSLNNIQYIEKWLSGIEQKFHSKIIQLESQVKELVTSLPHGISINTSTPKKYIDNNLNKNSFEQSNNEEHSSVSNTSRSRNSSSSKSSSSSRKSSSNSSNISGNNRSIRNNTSTNTSSSDNQSMMHRNTNLDNNISNATSDTNINNASIALAEDTIDKQLDILHNNEKSQGNTLQALNTECTQQINAITTNMYNGDNLDVVDMIIDDCLSNNNINLTSNGQTHTTITLETSSLLNLLENSNENIIVFNDNSLKHRNLHSTQLNLENTTIVEKVEQNTQTDESLFTEYLNSQNLSCSQKNRSIKKTVNKVNENVSNDVNNNANNNVNDSHDIRIRNRKKSINEGFDELSYNCAICKETFDRKTKLVDHIHKHHQLKKSMKCLICSKGFPTKLKFADHLMKEHSLQKFKPYNCEICNETFTKKTELVDHLIVDHNSRNNSLTKQRLDRYQCLQCPRTFQSFKNTHKHIQRVHGGAR